MEPDVFSINHFLQKQARQKPDELAFAFLENGVDVASSVTWGELERKVRSFAVNLRMLADQPGDRALLLYPSGIDFIVAFMGCLYAGIVAVPTIIPHLKRATPRLKSIVSDAQATLACTTRDMYGKIAPLIAEDQQLSQLRWVVNEEVNPALAEEWRPPDLDPDSVCFLQYTSGSTSEPRGVMISHFNLFRTIEDIKAGLDFNESSRMVTWLPIFHDLGLIYGLLTLLSCGGKAYIMSPVTFLEQPLRWLTAITKYQATHTAAPNFAYELCVRKITQEAKQGLDLSSVIAFVNAAEPVRLETMHTFYEAFKDRGLRPNAQAAGYGLAEATVKVASQHAYEGVVYACADRLALEQNRISFVDHDMPGHYDLVSSGTSEIGARILIINPVHLQPCSETEVGEIWVQSDSVALGYWNRLGETRDIFQAFTADGDGPYMRTGDLGFLWKGNLYITGRLKDMIIIQGRNYYPQDIELTVERTDPCLRPSCGAAFAVNLDETDRLVVVQEVRRDFRHSSELPAVLNAIRMAVARNHGLRAHAVILIPPHTVPKTTSGKIRRTATHRAYLNNELEVLAEWRAPDR